jgi:hypothetical protein
MGPEHHARKGYPRWIIPPELRHPRRWLAEDGSGCERASSLSSACSPRRPVAWSGGGGEAKGVLTLVGGDTSQERYASMTCSRISEKRPEWAFFLKGRSVFRLASGLPRPPGIVFLAFLVITVIQPVDGCHDMWGRGAIGKWSGGGIHVLLWTTDINQHVGILGGNTPERASVVKW